jgi:hypothetical protein
MWDLGGGCKEIDKAHGRFCKKILRLTKFAANGVAELS